MQTACDIAVVGSGFAGSLIALIARRLGRSVMLLEKSKHPRFVIGESSTPLANLLLEELSDLYGLQAIKPFAKYGAWKQAYPAIPVGLKRGFTFYHHRSNTPFVTDAEHSQELLVGASPNDRVADTHWYRPSFDQFFAEEAQRAGVTYLDEVELWGADVSAKRAVIQGRRRGAMLEIHADLILDASGPRGFLHRSLDLPEVPFRKMPRTQALYSHFTGVKRWDALHPAAPAGTPPPYPVDDAAMHHVFDGGWIWVLRFDNGITSAGAAVETKLANELHLAEGAPAWKRLLDRLPSVREQFEGATATIPFVHAKQLSFLSGDIAGQNWALLPSAAGFVDPLLSTGFPLTLLGVQRLAKIIDAHWGRPDFAAEMCAYSMQTTAELVSVGRLIAALYGSMKDFELFRALTLLYFAAASFTESARRLGKPGIAGNTFLLGEHPLFSRACRECIDAALEKPTGPAREALLQKIYQAIEPVNVAGLGDPARRHHYPALPADLLANAAKLQATTAEVEQMVHRCM